MQFVFYYTKLEIEQDIQKRYASEHNIISPLNICVSTTKLPLITEVMQPQSFAGSQISRRAPGTEIFYAASSKKSNQLFLRTDEIV